MFYCHLECNEIEDSFWNIFTAGGYKHIGAYWKSATCSRSKIRKEKRSFNIRALSIKMSLPYFRRNIRGERARLQKIHTSRSPMAHSTYH